MPRQITCVSALPGKTGKHENHIVHSNAVLVESAAAVDCVARTVHQCAVFLKEQEGQHPLTWQRAANFRLLANQWAERRLVTLWFHGCRAMRRSVCNAHTSNGCRSLCGQMSRERSYPCQYIDTTRKAIDCTTTLPLTVLLPRDAAMLARSWES